MPRKTTAERLAEAERKVEQAKARLAALRLRSSKQDRRQRTRRLIVLGAFIDTRLSQTDMATWVLEQFSQCTFREADREAYESIAATARETMPKKRNGKDWPELKFVAPATEQEDDSPEEFEGDNAVR